MQNLRLIPALFLLALAPAPASAGDINVVGLFPNKAVVSIHGGKPRTLSVGESTPEGVRLISADSDSATFEVGGKRQTLAAGQGAAVATTAFGGGGGGTVTLTADARGHFFTTGSINGNTVRFMVDTGASSVVLSSTEARRLGVNYLSGARGRSLTANGVVAVYRVKLDTVRVGDVTANNVDAEVLEGDRLPIVLLGMSFLNRMEMKRDGVTMTLTKRY